MFRQRSIALVFLFLSCSLAALGITSIMPWTQPNRDFNGAQAMQAVEKQMAFGARIPGSAAHQQTADWIANTLSDLGWQVERQYFNRMGHFGENIIATRGNGSPWTVLGAHYDTRMVADQDINPANRNSPVPGANDGASGVAVLLELARVLPQNPERQITLVFFDLEDQGNLPGWDWIMGSQAYAESLEQKPDAVVIVDMVGDKDLNIYLEQSSTQQLAQTIWKTANKNGYKGFIPELKYSMLDDHTPFLNIGIPAVDIIDFDYPAWHTISDTTDKVSADSLEQVGRTLQLWLEMP